MTVSPPLSPHFSPFVSVSRRPPPPYLSALMFSSSPPPVPLGFRRSPNGFAPPLRPRWILFTAASRSLLHLPSAPSGYLISLHALDHRDFRELKLRQRGCKKFRQIIFPVASFDENSIAIPPLIEEASVASGDGDQSGLESLIYSTGDLDLSTDKDYLETQGSSVEEAADHFATLKRVRKKRRIRGGILINMVLIAFLATFLLPFDWYSWRIVRLPLKPFYLLHPFTLSAALSAFIGCLYVPIVDSLRIHQILRNEGPATHSIKSGTPTMGGIIFIPVGVIVAIVTTNYNTQVFGVAVATVAFSAIGLLDDLFSCIKSHNYGLPGWIKLCLQVAVGAWFSLWLDSADISTPYNMKFLVPLPPPFGLVYLGKFYLVLTTFCFAAMSNGVNLTDGLDGLAGGTAALAFVGMSVAVLAICPELAVFGASMAGACVGFLFHNRYEASIFMGDTGSLALGGGLASMAACTGMFFPLFISSGIFFVEVLSVILQVSFKKVTKALYGTSRRIFRMAPLHHHFELSGFKEPIIVASVYGVSYTLALIAGYIGLISV